MSVDPGRCEDGPMTPVEFLNARLDELEARARDVQAGEAWHIGQGPETRQWWMLTVLADIAAKRAILALASAQFQPHAVMDGMGWEQHDAGLTAAYRAVVLQLTQPFADHPDFDDSWRP